MQPLWKSSEQSIHIRGNQMICKNCGCNMLGDGITVVFHCEYAAADIDIFEIEPDADPVYCNYDPYDENGHQG